MAKRVRTKSYSKEFQARLFAASDSDGVRGMGDLLLEKLKLALNRPGSRKDPSKTGEAPRRRTGRGRDSCVHEHDETTGVSRVGFGNKARHLWAHEAGIPYKKAGLQRRQSLSPTFKRFKKTLGETWIKFTKKGLSKLKLR